MSLESKNQVELNNFLKKLASSQNYFEQNRVEDSCEELKKIYLQQETFRHSYSEIYITIVAIDSDPQLSIEILAENLKDLRLANKLLEASCKLGMAEKPHSMDGVEAPESSHEWKSIERCLDKLCDHVNLEIARLSLAKFHQTQGEGRYKVITQDVDNKIKSLDEKTEEIQGQLKDTQRDYITILGVFAAIILAFTAGIAFSNSLLENIHKASIYRLVFGITLLGLVIMNIAYALFYYIDRLVQRKEEATLKFFLPANVILIAILVVNIIAWGCGWVEHREQAEHIVQYKEQNEPEAKNSNDIKVNISFDTKAE